MIKSALNEDFQIRDPKISKGRWTEVRGGPTIALTDQKISNEGKSICAHGTEHSTADGSFVIFRVSNPDQYLTVHMFHKGNGVWSFDKKNEHGGIQSHIRSFGPSDNKLILGDSGDRMDIQTQSVL